MAYRPLFKKIRDVESGEVLLSGVPDHLQNPILRWVEGLLQVNERYRGESYESGVLQTIEARCQIPLKWSPHDEISAWYSLRKHMAEHEEDALEVVNYLLFFLPADSPPARELESLLRMGGSAWTVTASEGHACLAERVPQEVQGRYEDLATKGRSGEHLQAAWSRMYGRDPSPSEAYDHAVKAVEVAGKPVISPKNGRTTLGTMIADFRNSPRSGTCRSRVILRPDGKRC